MAGVLAAFDSLRPVSLDEMNERAALQRRTDNKYLVPLDKLDALAKSLGDGHQVLEIDGERAFDYESTYFDTSSLQCFHDHIQDRRPRFKTRTRCYVTSGECHFEVKVKREDGETVKRNVDHEPDERHSMTSEAHALIDEVFPACGLTEPDDLAASLVTAFTRVTVVADDRPERTTFDFDVSLTAPGGDSARLEGIYAIAETKTEEGDGACDRALRDAGLEPISLSKYRMGTGLLHLPDEDAEYARDLKQLFTVRAASR